MSVRERFSQIDADTVVRCWDKKIDAMLQGMGVAGRIDLLKEIMGLKEVELKEVFGDTTAKRFYSRKMYTLTADGRQLRCWNGIPGLASRSHVDSCGEGLLFEVIGDPEKVRLYTEGLTKGRVAMKDNIGTTYFVFSGIL